MEIFDEIIKWASSLQLWQQTALLKILKQDEVSDDDVKALADLALEEAKDPVSIAAKVGDPLAGFKYEVNEAEEVTTTLSSLTATKNINAIKDGGELKFDEAGLTVIYGNNGTGKSGFSRVLKASCSCRDNEHVHGDVNRESADEPTALIKFKENGNEAELEWTQSAKPSAALKTVNIFDARSARVYLKGESDIKYVPAGLDVFDKLADVVRRVGDHIDERKSVIIDSRVNLRPLFEKYFETEAYELIGSLEHPDTKNRIDELKILNDTDSARLIFLSKSVPEKETNGPVKRRQIMGLKWQRYARIYNMLIGYRALLTKERIEELIELRAAMFEAVKVATEAEKEKFKDDEYLPGTGNAVWRELWQAAKDYSEVAYHEHTFPNIQEGAKCVLCQRPLDESTSLRFQSFHKFMSDKSQDLARKSKEAFEERLGDFKNPDLISSNQVEEVYIELEADEYPDKDKIEELVKEAIASYDDVVKKLLSADKDIELEVPTIDFMPTKTLKTYVDTIEEEAKEIDIAEFNKRLNEEKQELDSLQARKLLASYDKEIEKEFSNLERLDAIKKAAATTNTANISKQGGTMKDLHLVGSLRQSFDSELMAIYDRKLIVELKKSRTSVGVTYSEITLSAEVDGKRLSPEDVMSESEQKVVSLAGYFAELSMTPHIKSAIVLDDPVTSLDHLNIGKIAKRIVTEAKTRQVIVFTHNIVFATHLIEQTKKILKKEPYTEEITRMPMPGNVTQGLPWDALGVNKRIGKLKDKLADLGATFRRGESEKYQDDGEAFYKRLRETWERAIEEVLFGDAVKRYKRDIETSRLKDVKFVSADHEVVEDNMKRCGDFIHDNVDEESSPVPDPDILTKDLDVLINWVAGVRNR